MTVRAIVVTAAALAVSALAAPAAGAASGPSQSEARSAALRVARHAAARLPGRERISPARCRRGRAAECRIELRLEASTPVTCRLVIRVTRKRRAVRTRLLRVACRAAVVAPPGPAPAPAPTPPPGTQAPVALPGPPDESSGPLVPPMPRG